MKCFLHLLHHGLLALSPALQPQHRCIAEKELWCPVVFLLFISLHSISWGLWWFGSLSFGYSADLFVFFFFFFVFDHRHHFSDFDFKLLFCS